MPPFPPPTQQTRRQSAEVNPCGNLSEQFYRGTWLLNGQVSLITGCSTLIGRAMASAFAREGADVALTYLDGRRASALIHEVRRQCLTFTCLNSDFIDCHALVRAVVDQLGRRDVPINTVAHHITFRSLRSISYPDWRRTFAVTRCSGS